jgi:hypothetical protein
MTTRPGRGRQEGTMRRASGRCIYLSSLTLYPEKSGRFSEHACGIPLRSPPKGLPGPVSDLACTARRARLSSIQPDSSAWHLVQDAFVLYTHGNDLPWNAGITMQLARYKVSEAAFCLRGQETGNLERPFILWLKLRAFLAHVTSAVALGCSSYPPATDPDGWAGRAHRVKQSRYE